MKLKVQWFIVVCCLIAGFVFALMKLNEVAEQRVDMQYYNQICKTIEQNDIGNSNELEQKYHCMILLANHSGYETRLNNAINNYKIVFDLHNKNGNVIGKIIFSGNREFLDEGIKTIKIILVVIFVVLFLILTTVYLVFYQKYMKPFYKLQSFAGNVAKGDLEFLLPIYKDNYFGSFTESFDLLREELRIARLKEQQANQSKKELVAELSHDIKTPVATIKTSCEVLELKVDNPEYLQKIQTIYKKADTIESLMNNLFHATIEELKVLKIQPKEELSTVIPMIIQEFDADERISFKNEIPGGIISMDKLRFSQAVGNVISNSYKYANTAIEVSFQKVEGGIKVTFRDFGPGVEEEDLPYLMEKYYRGNHTEQVEGGGLGLFLAKSFLDGMNGSMDCYNDNGFIVEFFLPFAK